MASVITIPHHPAHAINLPQLHSVALVQMQGDEMHGGIKAALSGAGCAGKPPTDLLPAITV